jgi:ring-1,2-phenylacetyl-CoA epoxidase subunit PaaC
MNESNYTIHLADNSLIMGHRLSEWTGHGPTLEQDIALSNIALDLIGQSRNFYQYAAQLINTGENRSGENLETEDTLAYLRDPQDFKNIILAELPNGDWAETILKLFFFSTYQYFLYQQLMKSSDTQLSAIAEKSLKEVTYHLRWSSEWVIRLGDGTEESKQRMEKALGKLWDYTSEIFLPAEYEIECANNNIGVDVSSLRNDWNNKVMDVLQKSTLQVPVYKGEEHFGKLGIHTAHLSGILSEMQHLQRTYPGSQW